MHLDTSLVPCWVTDLFSAPAAVRLGWVCIHSLWQGVAVAAVLAAALRLHPRQSSAALALRYRLAAAALAALPVAAGGTFFLVPAWSDAVKPQPSQMNIAPRPAAVAEGAPGMAGFGAAPAPLLLGRQEVQPDSLVRLAAWLPLVALAWTVGAALAAARMACGWWITRRLVARATPAADGRLQGRVNHWRRIMRIDGAVRILASAAVETPVVVGWLKPVILWPAAALMGMPAHEIDAVLAHELAHVRRRDALMNLLQACIDVLFFHHPAAWWISRQVRAEREHCADDLAVSALEADRAGSRLSYARALLALEQRRQTATLAVAANGGRLLDRIRRLAGDDHEPAGTARLLAAGLTAVALIAVTVSFTTNPRRATADELPEDTNTIESLTPEQARKLVKEFPGVEMEVEPGFKDHFCLPLNGLKSLDAVTARALAGYRRGTLSLGGLTTLDADSATALATLQSGALALNGLTAITPAAAEALAAFDGTHLYLDGMTTLDAASAKALAPFKGDELSLDGLTTIDAATATVLVGFKGMWDLSLNRLRTLDALAARALAAYEGDELTLDGLTTLDAATARAVAASKAQILSLDGLPRLDADTAKALGTFAGEHVSLEGLVRLDAQTAKELAGSRAWSGRLPKLTTLDAAAATALSAFAGDELCLDGLTTLEPEIATALAGYAGHELRLCGLAEVDPRVAAALATSRCKALVLDGLTGLDASLARVFATFKGGSLCFKSVPALDAEAAEALATFKGRLHFNEHERVQTTYANAHPLDPTTVRVYAALFEGKVPTSRLDADMAAALVGWPGPLLDLTGLDKLDAPTTRLLAGIESWNGDLPNLTALDSPDAVAVAQALATRKGPLYLPNLKKLSPRTLSALLDKEDLEIPLIETLELIPEPDGSPTDDLVIPEKFQQRQRR